MLSEELDLVAKQILAELPDNAPVIKGIVINGSFFHDVAVPDRSGVNDPYNARLSAVAANFNTVFLNKLGRKITTAEVQTPLTPTAKCLARRVRVRLLICVVRRNGLKKGFCRLMPMKTLVGTTSLSKKDRVYREITVCQDELSLIKVPIRPAYHTDLTADSLTS